MNFYQYLKKLQSAHLSLLLGALLIALMGLLFSANIPIKNELKNDFLYIVPVVLLLGIALSNYYFKQEVEAIKRKSRLSPKLRSYSVAIVKKWSILNFPAFFALFAYFFTQYLFFLSLAILPILLLLLNRPTIARIQDDLELSNAEKRVLADIELDVV